MSSSNNNLSNFSSPLPDGKLLKVGIVCAEWNNTITSKLFDGALALLQKANISLDNIEIINVPGTFELPLAAQKLAQNPKIEGVICLGCVIEGETPHFDYICQATAQGIMDLGLKFNKPIIFGVLTTNTLQQAEDRAGGKHGNKGEEAAFTLLKMLAK